MSVSSTVGIVAGQGRRSTRSVVQDFVFDVLHCVKGTRPTFGFSDSHYNSDPDDRRDGELCM